MLSFHIWLEATRPKTLPAALVPVVLGSSLAHADGHFNWLPAMICLAFATLVQIGTNFANDYLDGVRGTDTKQRLGPRRAVADGLIAPVVMKRATLWVLTIGFCVGLGLIPFGGWWLLVIGMASVLCAWCYTGGPYPFAYNGLGDVFVILFFGLIAVGCTYYVQTGIFSYDSLMLGFGCGLLVNNLLVVNNYRDLEEDRVARKRTLVVFWGRKFALFQYRLSLLLAAVVAVFFWIRGYGACVLLALMPVVYGQLQVRRLAEAKSAEDFLVALKNSAKAVFAYGFLFSAGLVLPCL